MAWWQVAVTAALGLIATAGGFIGARLGVRANDGPPSSVRKPLDASKAWTTTRPPAVI